MNIIKKVLQENNLTYKNLTKIKSGLSNKAYDIDDKYILRLTTKYSKGFQTEKRVLDMINTTISTPKILSIGNTNFEDQTIYYSLVEKLKGRPLSEVWINTDKTLQSKYIKLIAREIQLLHKIPLSGFEFLKQDVEVLHEIHSDINKSIDTAKQNGLPKEVYDHIRSFFDKHGKLLLSERRNVLCHSDLHFENIIVTEDDNIVLIDFELVSIMPAFYEFVPPCSFAIEPKSFLHSPLSDQYPNAPLKYYPDFIKAYPILLEEENIETLMNLLMIESILWAWGDNSYKLLEDDNFKAFTRIQSLLIYKRVFKDRIVENWIKQAKEYSNQNK